MREVVCEGLRDDGYRVRQAVDGLAALSVLETKVVQLVLSEVQMPRLGALALAHLLLARVIRCRSSSWGPSLRVNG